MCSSKLSQICVLTLKVKAGWRNGGFPRLSEFLYQTKPPLFFFALTPPLPAQFWCQECFLFVNWQVCLHLVIGLVKVLWHMLLLPAPGVDTNILVHFHQLKCNQGASVVTSVLTSPRCVSYRCHVIASNQSIVFYVYLSISSFIN